MAGVDGLVGFCFVGVLTVEEISFSSCSLCFGSALDSCSVKRLESYNKRTLV